MHNTRELADCLILDIIPGQATCVDYGIVNQTINGMAIDSNVYGALQWAFRNNFTNENELKRVCGNGEMLTKIVQRGDNPYGKKLVVSTMWDNITDEEEDDEV